MLVVAHCGRISNKKDEGWGGIFDYCTLCHHRCCPALPCLLSPIVVIVVVMVVVAGWWVVVGGVGNGVSWWWLWVVSWLNEPVVNILIYSPFSLYYL